VFKLILKNLETSVELITTGDFMVCAIILVVVVAAAAALQSKGVPGILLDFMWHYTRTQGLKYLT